MAGLISQFSGQSVEGVQETSTGAFQRVVMTTAMEGTTTLSGKKSVEVLVKDDQDNEQLCVATVNFGTVSPASVESINGKTGVIVLTGEDIDVNTDTGAKTIDEEFTEVNTSLGTLGTGLTTAQGNIGTLQTKVSGIEDKIPTDASTSNKLATASDITGITEKIPSGASSSNKLATASDVAGVLPEYPTDDGSYVLKYVVEDGVGTLSWVKEEA